MIDVKMIQVPKGVLFSEEEFEKILKERDAIKRALWQARAMRARAEWISLKYDINSNQWVKWQKVEQLCRKKAEEYL